MWTKIACHVVECQLEVWSNFDFHARETAKYPNWMSEQNAKLRFVMCHQINHHRQLYASASFLPSLLCKPSTPSARWAGRWRCRWGRTGCRPGSAGTRCRSAWRGTPSGTSAARRRRAAGRSPGRTPSGCCGSANERWGYYWTFFKGKLIRGLLVATPSRRRWKSRLVASSQHILKSFTVIGRH